MKPLLVLLTVFLIACGGSDAENTATPAAVATVSDEGRPRADHPQLIYSTQTQALPTPDNSVQVTKTIYSVDLQTGQRYQLAEYGGAAGAPVAGWLGGKHLVTVTTKNVTRADVDGRNAQEIFRTPQGYDYIKDGALSPDGSKIALLLEDNRDRNGSLIVFIEPVGGRELGRTARSAPAFNDFRGYFTWLQWRSDSAAVVVTSFVNSHASGDVATVSPSGSIKINAVEGWPTVTPSGDRIADGPDVICYGLLISGHEIKLRDTASGRILASVSDETKVFTPWTWAPDGSEFLYQERFMGTDSECPLVTYRLLNTSGADSAIASDMQVYDRWFGKRLVTLVCAGDEKAMLYRSGKLRLSCNDMMPVELRLAHKTVDQLPPGYQDVEVLGFLNY
jgi:hypothetical protein